MRLTQHFRPEVAALLEDLVSCIEREIVVRSIVLFGSMARGDYTRRSDIDFIVVSDDFPEAFCCRFDLLRPILLRLRQGEGCKTLRCLGYRIAFNPIPYRSKDLWPTPPLLIDVTVDGILLKDDGLMAAKLGQVSQRMAELGSERHWTKRGGWYWLLKPDITPGETFEI